MHERHQNRSDVEEARERIQELVESGAYPHVTVLREHLTDILTHGLRPRGSAYQKGVHALIGTLGITPFLPKDEDRVILELAIDDPKKISPRLTGPDRSFNGVVEIRSDCVLPEYIRVIDPLQEEEKAA